MFPISFLYDDVRHSSYEGNFSSQLYLVHCNDTSFDILFFIDDINLRIIMLFCKPISFRYLIRIISYKGIHCIMLKARMKGQMYAKLKFLKRIQSSFINFHD